MGTVLFVLQVAAALIFLALMAVQTDRAEQSGVMGLGGQGGRMSGSIDMPVGAERILKPLTKWIVIAFVFLSGLASMHHGLIADGAAGVTIVHFAIAVALYLVIMLLGNKIWEGFLRIFGAQN